MNPRSPIHGQLLDDVPILQDPVSSLISVPVTLLAFVGDMAHVPLVKGSVEIFFAQILLQALFWPSLEIWHTYLLLRGVWRFFFFLRYSSRLLLQETRKSQPQQGIHRPRMVVGSELVVCASAFISAASNIYAVFQ